MKTRHIALFTGILLAVAATSVQAHDDYRYAVPDARVSGGISVWGGSGGVAGWTGAIRIGTPVVAVPAYAPVVVAPPVYRHHHGARCHHGPTYARGHGHAKAYRKGYAKGRRDAHRHGYYD